MSKIPRWLVLQGEIDMRYWQLKKMLKQAKSRQPIERMVDQATGFDRQRIKEAEELMAEIDELKAEYYEIKDLSK